MVLTVGERQKAPGHLFSRATLPEQGIYSKEAVMGDS